jgi:hypothetical protein
VSRRRRTTRGLNGPGRTRIRLARLLAALGLVATPERLYPVEGFYRTAAAGVLGYALWSGDALAGTARIPCITFPDREPLTYPPDFKVSFYSHDSMTNCVRYGIQIGYHVTGHGVDDLEVWAKLPDKTP